MWEGSQCPLHMQEGEGPEGSRGARLLWLDKERIVISGFNKLSEAVAIGNTITLRNFFKCATSALHIPLSPSSTPTNDPRRNSLRTL